MQRSNDAHPACAACKHQRKKCSEKCVLAPYFPSSRNREFEAVHKVFGVSNITKLVKNVRMEDRKKVVESLVWEACCRQKDPVQGPYGEYTKIYHEYKKVFYELQIIRGQNHPKMQLPTYQALKSVQDFIPYNGAKEKHKTETDDIALSNYLQANKNYNVISNSNIYNNYSSNYLQGLELENMRPEVAIPSYQQLPYYVTGDQFNQ